MRNTILAILTMLSTNLVAQHTNLRKVELSAGSDTIVLDSLSLVPGTVVLSGANGEALEEGTYKIDHGMARLIIDESLKDRTIQVQYRVFDENFGAAHRHKDYNRMLEEKPGLRRPESYIYQPGNNDQLYSDKLDKQGSISRGFSIGNNQDMVMSSDLNLQLSGPLTDKLNIRAAISDNNIPIQPEGNSQQLQEFDKVFISIYNENTDLTVGDFEINTPEQGYFMRLNKKSQGGIVTQRFNIGQEKDMSYTTRSGMAVSKGKYCRKSFMGMEGNQGPYKLEGCDNEQVIIILAGTEKVYIDGELMQRGMDKDYVIDYNTGELTFTPQRPITKDKRIVVEFEYSEKRYARFLIYSENYFKTENSTYWANLVSENDSKNQTVTQELDEMDKLRLNQAGDAYGGMLVPNVDSVGWDDSQVLYARRDTVVDGITYENVYVYSTDPAKAHYRLGFSLVGQGNGNYRQVLTPANGRTYEWVAPVKGRPQGDYEPVNQLVPPRSKQLLTAGGENRIGDGWRTFYEGAYSHYDQNTFSGLDHQDDNGFAFRSRLEKDVVITEKKEKLTLGAGYEMSDRYFEPAERYKTAEFSRDWNLDGSPLNVNEHLLNFGTKYSNTKTGNAAYDLDYMMRGGQYGGLRNSLSADQKLGRWHYEGHGSWLLAEDSLNNSSFLRHYSRLYYDLGPIYLGVDGEQELNEGMYAQADSLLANSFHYYQMGAFLRNPDTTENKFNLDYHRRKDFLPLGNNLRYSSVDDNVNAGYQWLSHEHHSLKLMANYRNLRIIDSSLAAEAPEETYTGRLEYGVRIWEGALSTNTFFEAGSGQEIKKAFSYLEVAPGQGAYAWNDYNGNGVKELDEFEVAAFQDQASYIRIFTPTNDYVGVYTSQYSQMVNLRPERLWRKSESSFLRALSLFSDQFAYKTGRKVLRDDFFKQVNPFVALPEDSMLTSLNNSIRNSFSFNTSGREFRADVITRQSRQRILLINGPDTRSDRMDGLQLRWNINNQFTVENEAGKGLKKYSSSYFDSKNYKIGYYKDKVSGSFQPNLHLRFTLSYEYTDKKNRLGSERAYMNDMGLEFRYSTAGRGNLTAQFNYILIAYRAGELQSVSYEMLEGLSDGRNLTWMLTYQRNITENLQMDIGYNGRQAGDLPIVHVGSMQLRAYF